MVVVLGLEPRLGAYLARTVYKAVGAALHYTTKNSFVLEVPGLSSSGLRGRLGHTRHSLTNHSDYPDGQDPPPFGAYHDMCPSTSPTNTKLN